jgi:hypothetical protein
MKSIIAKIIFTTVFLIIMTGVSFASHPLTSDDPGTNGTGGFLAELNTAYNITDKVFDFAPVFTLGIAAPLDIVFRPDTDLHTFNDPYIDIKWRYYEDKVFSAALKPSFLLPFKTDFVAALHMMFAQKIIQKAETEVEKGKERGVESGSSGIEGLNIIEDIAYDTSKNYQAHIAICFEPVESFIFVFNAGSENSFNSIFMIGGIIVEITEAIHYDIGYKYEIAKDTKASSLINGLSFAF